MKPYTHFTLEEREIIAESLKEKKSFHEIARQLGRNVSSVSREVKRNFSKMPNRYHPWRATALAKLSSKKAQSCTHLLQKDYVNSGRLKSLQREQP